MSVITNFNTLSENELQQFAETLVHKINKDFIFSADVTFKVSDVDVNEIQGDLVISVYSCDGFLEVSREAAWQCNTEEEIYNPEQPDYYNSIYADARRAFKTLTAIIDGYTVNAEIAEITEEDISDVIVETYSHEDGGIGAYEYWGYTGYDSQPYVEVEGTIVQNCTCYLSIWVEPR